MVVVKQLSVKSIYGQTFIERKDFMGTESDA